MAEHTQNKENHSSNNFINDEIGETLLITLYMKSVESQKENPIIKDEEAIQLVDKINYDFNKFKKAKTTSIGVAIRANYFDEMLISFIKQNKNPVIVIIGCGLDSRYNRIGKYAEKATFYQLDIPEVINIRTKYISPNENETYLPYSMLNYEWITLVKNENPSGNFLFIIEGVLMYFSKHNVKSVFKKLSQEFNDSEILFDTTNVWLSKNSHLQDSVKLMRANFVFGTDNDKEMETWAKNLTHLSTKYYTDFSAWKRIGIKGWIMSLIPKFKKAGRMLHYKIT